jgi:hypothetical protein
MLLPTLLPLFAALYASTTAATALTYRLAASDKECFFTDVQQRGAKIAFYFAVGYVPSPRRVGTPGLLTTLLVVLGAIWRVV